MRIRNGIVTTSAKATETRDLDDILISHRRLAADVMPFRSFPFLLPFSFSLFLSLSLPFSLTLLSLFPLQSSHSCCSLFLHSRTYTSATFSPIAAVLSSLCLFSATRNRVLPARKLPRAACGCSRFSLPIFPVILRRTLHVLPYLALGITSDGRKVSLFANRRIAISGQCAKSAIIIGEVENKPSSSYQE